jgi:hypothetical protein
MITRQVYLDIGYPVLYAIALPFSVFVPTVHRFPDSIRKQCIGFEVLTAVDMRSPIFWDITPCCL